MLYLTCFINFLSQLSQIFRILEKHNAQGSVLPQLRDSLNIWKGAQAFQLPAFHSFFHLCTLFEVLIIHFLFNFIIDGHSFFWFFPGSLGFVVWRGLYTLSLAYHPGWLHPLCWAGRAGSEREGTSQDSHYSSPLHLHPGSFPPLTPPRLLFHSFLSSFKTFFYLFVAALGLRCCIQGFSSCSEQGLFSRWGARASHCDGFSCFRARTLGHSGFRSSRGWCLL